MQEINYRKEAISAYLKQKKNKFKSLPFQQIDRWFAFICVLFVVIFLILFFGSYSKKTLVNGVLIPDKGLSNIYSPSNGTVTKLFAKVGDEITQGERLLSLNFSESNKLDDKKFKEKINTIEDQIKKIDEKIELKKIFRESYIRLGKEKINGMESTQRAKKETHKNYMEKLDISRSRLNSYEPLLSTKMISKKELEDVKLQMITAKLELNVAYESLLDISEELRTAKGDLDQFEISSKIEIADLELNKYKLLDELNSLKASNTYDIFAPIDGKVIALQVHEGERVGDLVILASILPKDSQLVGKLFIDAESVGHIRDGQSIKISFSAFPRADYGSVNARLSQKGNVVLKSTEINSPIELSGENYFISIAELESQSIVINSENIYFQPGMQFEAIVILDTKRIYEWLLRPLFEKFNSLS